MGSPHAARLERWLGADQLATLEEQMRGWYGPPIPIAGIPGRPVYVHRGGDFSGSIKAGQFASLADWQWQRAKKAFDRWTRKQAATLNGGFSSFGDLVSEATAGAKRREYAFQKVGTTGGLSTNSSLWRVGNMPSAGGAAAAAPGGSAPTSASTGAIPFDNPAAGDTQHLVSGFPGCTVAGNTLLLYDRIFEVNKTMSSLAAETVSGVPTRYTNTVAGSVDSAEGNFLMMEVQATLAAVAHTWTASYTNQAGVAAKTLPAVTGISGAVTNRIDSALSGILLPLVAGDSGIASFQSMTCNVNTVTGTLAYVMGHPLAWMPMPLAFITCIHDGINSAFNLARIFDNACLAFLEVCKPSTTATTYYGTLITVRG